MVARPDLRRRRCSPSWSRAPRSARCGQRGRPAAAGLAGRAAVGAAAGRLHGAARCGSPPTAPSSPGRCRTIAADAAAQRHPPAADRDDPGGAAARHGAGAGRRGLAGRARRRRAGAARRPGAARLLPPALLYAGALYVVGPNAAAAGWPTLAFAALVAVAALALTGRSAPRRRRPTPASPRGACGCARARRRGRRAGAWSALVAGCVGPWVGGRVAGDAGRPPPVRRAAAAGRLDENPLIRISGWALNPEQTPPRRWPPTPLGASGDDRRLRLAVLLRLRRGDLAGRRDLPQRRAGPAAAAGDSPDAERQTVRQEITVAELTGRLLPVGADARPRSTAPGSPTTRRPAR